MGVYVKVPEAECWKNTGKAPISTKWIDINKGDSTNPKYRSRNVAREIAKSKLDGLFAATPPLEAVKTLVSLAASQRNISKNKVKNLMLIDVSKAYFHAPVTRDVYIVLPEEALEPHERGGHICGKLQFSLYGTRDAAQNLQKEYTCFMTSIGFQVG